MKMKCRRLNGMMTESIVCALPSYVAFGCGGCMIWTCSMFIVHRSNSLTKNGILKRYDEDLDVNTYAFVRSEVVNACINSLNLQHSLILILMLWVVCTVFPHCLWVWTRFCFPFFLRHFFFFGSTVPNPEFCITLYVLYDLVCPVLRVLALNNNWVLALP